MSKKRNNKNKILYLIICAILTVITTYFIQDSPTSKPTSKFLSELPSSSQIINEELQIYFFDVGQADSILVVNNNETMLIDAGNNEDGYLLSKYIKNLGISKIDYLIGTHIHEDHIGGLDNIIKDFDIGTIYMPYSLDSSKTYEDVLDAIHEKSLQISEINIGNKFNVGYSECAVLYVDNSEPFDKNDSSICIDMHFGSQAYLFMADASSAIEDILEKEDISVLKVGHHGSSSSTSKDFLKAVTPEIAIISVGKNNDYKHPSQKTINRLLNENIEIYRTDIKGTILLTSDGVTNSIKTLKTKIDGN